MPIANTVSTANGILNKGRRPPKSSVVSAADAERALNKSRQTAGVQNPSVNLASESPDTTSSDGSLPITNLVDVFERVLTE